jgi:hypothetical protein
MPIFDDAFLAASCAILPNPRDAFFEKRFFLHLPYNPQDPPSKVFQHVFRNTLLTPSGEIVLPAMHNNFGAKIKTNRMIVAYHRPPNLKNLLFPHRFASRFDCTPSTVLAELLADS